MRTTVRSEDTVPAAGSGGASDDVVFSFRMAEGTLLRFYSDDIEFVRKVADLSRFGELELPGSSKCCLNTRPTRTTRV